MIEQIIGMFEEAGCSTTKSSRVGEYRRAFENLRNAASTQNELSLESSEQILQSLVDFEQLRVILRAFTTASDKTRWFPALRRVVEGHPFPLHAARPEASSGRDVQFECYIAAVLQLSGIAAELSEPDVVVLDSRYPFCIAAKRPRDVAAVERNVKKAKKQIVRVGGKGIIALDLSDALHHGHLVRSASSNDAALFVERAVEDFLRRYHYRVHRLLSQSNVVAILINVHLPVQTYSSDGRKQLATTFKWTYAALSPPATDDDSDRVMRLARACETGLFGATGA